MSVDLDRGYWVCFKCGEKGNLTNLAARMGSSIDPGVIAKVKAESVNDLYEEAPDFSVKAGALHRNALKVRPMAIVRYILDRGLTKGILNQFNIGWDGERISMPYAVDERVVGIKYRYPDGHKTNEPGTQRYLYNVNEARNQRTVIICEGESDTQAVWSYIDRLGMLGRGVGVTGVPGVGKGLPGRKTWELWSLEMLWSEAIYIAFDNDEAGDWGAEIPLSIFGDRAHRVVPTKGKDMAEHLLKGGTLRECGMDEAHLFV